MAQARDVGWLAIIGGAAGAVVSALWNNFSEKDVAHEAKILELQTAAYLAFADAQSRIETAKTRDEALKGDKALRLASF